MASARSGEGETAREQDKEAEPASLRERIERDLRRDEDNMRRAKAAAAAGQGAMLFQPTRSPREQVGGSSSSSAPPPSASALADPLAALRDSADFSNARAQMLARAPLPSFGAPGV